MQVHLWFICYELFSFTAGLVSAVARWSAKNATLLLKALAGVFRLKVPGRVFGLKDPCRRLWIESARVSLDWKTLLNDFLCSTCFISSFRRAIVPWSLPYMQMRMGNAYRITLSYMHLIIGWFEKSVKPHYPMLKYVKDNVILYALPMRICV